MGYTVAPIELQWVSNRALIGSNRAPIAPINFQSAFDILQSLRYNQVVRQLYLWIIPLQNDNPSHQKRLHRHDG